MSFHVSSQKCFQAECRSDTARHLPMGTQVPATSVCWQPAGAWSESKALGSPGPRAPCLSAPSRSPRGTPPWAPGAQPDAIPSDTSCLAGGSCVSEDVACAGRAPGGRVRGWGLRREWPPAGTGLTGLRAEPGRARRLAVREAIRWWQQRLESWGWGLLALGGSEDIFSVESSRWLSA